MPVFQKSELGASQAFLRIGSSPGPGFVLETLEPRRLLSFVSFPIPVAAGGDLEGYFSTRGPDGNIWIADLAGPRILRVEHDGSVAHFALPKQSDPGAIVSGPDGNVWFTDDGLNKIGKITPAGKITEFTLPATMSLGFGSSSDLTAGPDGNLWFAGSDAKSSAALIGRITPGGAITRFAVPKKVAEVDVIASGPDGNLWFSALDANESILLGRITPQGTISLFPYSPTPSKNLFPVSFAINSILTGPDGNLWICVADEIDRITTAGKVAARFTIDAPSAFDGFPGGPFDLTLGPDSDFWFQISESSNQIGRMNLAGISSLVTIPGGKPLAAGSIQDFGPQVESLTTGGDGDLWMPTSDDTILRLDLHDSILAANEYVDASAGTVLKTTVAQFIDTGPSQPASNYKATIAFDDGTTANGTITANASGNFNVTVAHAWPIGDSTATVTITDIHNPTRTATAADFANAIPLKPLGSALTVSAVAGTAFDGNVARFTHVDLTSLDQYSVFIDWGDGQQVDGSLVPDGTGGAFAVGSHAYAQPGHFSISVDVLAPFVFPRLFGNGPPFPQDGQIVSKATVAAGAMSGTGFTLLAQSHHAITQNEATFTLTNASADLSHYHARLEWGDLFTDPQHPTIAADIQPRGNGLFLVRVPAIFDGQGIAYYRIVISDDRLGTSDGAIVGVAYGQILVDYPVAPPPADFGGDHLVDLPTARIQGATGDEEDGGLGSFEDNYNPTLGERVSEFGQTLTGAVGTTFSGDVGRLSGYVPNTPNLKDLHGTILWGDGTLSSATFTRDSQGLIHVRGAHVYARAGKYSIAVYLSQTIYQTGKPEGLPDMHLPTVFSSIRVTGKGG